MTPSLSQLEAVVHGDLCHRCGACAGMCPATVIEPDEDGFPSWAARVADCTDCGLCVRVCPGREFSFPEHYRNVFQQEADIRRAHGVFLKAFLGYATDPELRAQTTSGGLGTQLPLYLLRSGRIKGALAVRSNPDCPWKPQAFIARTEEQLRMGMLSKYPACSTNHILRTLRKESGPFLLTGIPCQIHGFRKMEALNRALGDKVALTVGLLCHSCLDHQALRDMLDYYQIAGGDLERVLYRCGKLPGYVRAQTRSGDWVGLPYPHAPLNAYRPNAKECLTFLFKFYSPMRCRMCLDATAEFADIAIGDPWIRGWQGIARLKRGYNAILARTARGLKVLEEAAEAGVIALEPFPETQARVSQLPMVRSKRRRACYNINTRRRAGLPVPEYGLDTRLSPADNRRAVLHAMTYAAAGRPRLRRRLMGLLLSPLGRWFVGLVFFRRHVLQNMLEKAKTAIKGEQKPGGD